MTAFITVKFRHELANYIVDSTANSNFYLCVGKSTQFPSDIAPPTPTDAVQTSHYDVFRNLIFGKKISSQDVRVMIRRYDWVPGVVYTPYDQDNVNLYRAGTQFYVLVDEGLSYSVFKCLGNNNGAASTHKPSLFETAADDDFYTTADGYQWKYMYTIDRSEYEKFATTKYIPVIPDQNVAANAVSGAIEAIRVTNRGTRYNSYTNGTIQVARVNGNNQLYAIDPERASSNTDFYKNSVIKIVAGPGAGQQRLISEYIVSGSNRYILTANNFNLNDVPTEESQYEISPNVVVSGDGEGFIGRALVNAISNTIYGVEISDKGRGYTWANAVVIANTGIIDAVSNTVVQANNATLKVLISPPGGHGANTGAELGGMFAGISMTFNTLEAGGRIIANNDFRTISVIHNPKIANVVLGIEDCVVVATEAPTTFSIGDTLTQTFKTAKNQGVVSGTIEAATTSSVQLSNVVGVFGATSATYETDNPQDDGDISYGPIYNSTNTIRAKVADPSNNGQNPTTYFDQTTTLIAEFDDLQIQEGFYEDELVYQRSPSDGSYAAYGYALSTIFDVNNPANTHIKLVDTKGIFNQTEDVGDTLSEGMLFGRTSQSTAIISAIKHPDLVPASGDVLYIENITPISRANGQSETVKIIVEF